MHSRLADLSPLHRLFFVALWTQADKAGRLEDDTKKIKVTCLPYDDCDVNQILDDLQSHADRLIIRYVVDEKKYIQINGFELHQRPHHTERASVIPPLNNRHKTVNSRLRDDSPLIQNIKEKNYHVRDGKQKENRQITVNSRLFNRKKKEEKGMDTGEGKGMDKGKESEENHHPNLKNVKIPLPDRFSISDRVREWAKKKGFDQLEEHLEAFKRKAKMNAYKYANWDDAFMEAVREDWAKIRKERKEPSLADKYRKL